MKRLIQAWGGTALGTVIGLSNAIVVTRTWDVADAADFFLIPVIILAIATIAEFGLGILSVHDAARLAGSESHQAYVNAAIRTAARRAVIPAAIAGPLCWVFVEVDGLTAVGISITTVFTTVALTGQPLLRGSDRRVLASVGGAVAATILTGFVIIPVALLGLDVAPVTAVLVGYSSAGIATIAALVRPVAPGHSIDHALLHARRSRFAAGHEVANMSGRQIDSMLAGWLMSDRQFTDYSVTIRMTAPLGLIAFAANQAVARDMHRIVDGRADAINRAAGIYRWALAAAIVAAAGLVVAGPTVGSVVFGDSVEVRRAYLAVIGAGYLVSVAGSAGGMLLAAGEHTPALLRSSITALSAAAAAAAVAAIVGETLWAAPIFITGWLVFSTILAARAARRHLGLSVWIPTFGHPVAPRA